MKTTRLLFIGNHCPPLAPEALKTAIAIIKQDKDVRLYRQAVQALQVYTPNDPDAKLDEDWIEKTTREVKQKTDRLEAELKSYKNNMIKESIRVITPPSSDFSLTNHKSGNQTSNDTCCTDRS